MTLGYWLRPFRGNKLHRFTGYQALCGTPDLWTLPMDTFEINQGRCSECQQQLDAMTRQLRTPEPPQQLRLELDDDHTDDQAAVSLAAPEPL